MCSGGDAFMAWPSWLGTRFRRQPRAPKKARPFGLRGLDRSARPKPVGCHTKNAQMRLSGSDGCRRTGDMGNTPRTERVVEGLQSPLLEVDVAEIVVHEANEPNAIVDLLDAERLTCEHG